LCGLAFSTEIELPLPESLKNLLVDDFDLISRQRKTLMLPARTNVADFIQSFYEQGEEANKIEVEGVCNGLCSYFDSTLGTQLLYKFERIQYSDIMKEHPGVLMSKLYPPIHLLRLLTRMPNLLATANLEPQALSALISTLTLLVEFIDERKGEVFKKEDYGTASPEYHRRAL
jgi:mortality factor 4-like protein 1